MCAAYNAGANKANVQFHFLAKDIFAGRSVRGFVHGFFGAVSDAFATFDAFVVVDYRIAVGALGYGSDRADPDEGTEVVVGTEGSIEVYHDMYF